MTLPLHPCPCGSWHSHGYRCPADLTSDAFDADLDDVADSARFTVSRGDQLDDLVDGLDQLLAVLDGANLWDGIE